MNGNASKQWLEAARGEAARRAPDPMVETQLLARVRERGALRTIAAARPARVAAAPWWTRLSFTLPAALAGVVALVVGVRQFAPAPAAVAAREVATPFIALVGTDALAAQRAPVVVASQVARTALADYGLPVDPARADEPIDAEFLVSPGGVVLAVRFRNE